MVSEQLYLIADASNVIGDESTWCVRMEMRRDVSADKCMQIPNMVGVALKYSLYFTTAITYHKTANQADTLSLLFGCIFACSSV